MSKRSNNIMNDLFDVIISLVRLGGSIIMDKYQEIKSVYFDSMVVEDEEENYIWNGGVTNSIGSRIDDDESTKTPYDDNIIYDGVYDDIK